MTLVQRKKRDARLLEVDDDSQASTPTKEEDVEGGRAPILEQATEMGIITNPAPEPASVIPASSASSVYSQNSGHIVSRFNI